MTRTTHFIIACGIAFLSCTSAKAGPAFTSPAFVQQASGSGYARMDMSSIMKPVMDLVSNASSVNASGLANNLVFVNQTGDFNTATIEQTGARNVGFIQQIGYNNAASVTQSGVGHQALVFQQGRNNTAFIRQR
ncbi:hypothetical protein [Rhizobium sp. Root482]|uniref:hypothetical protein n=1 Tax=Rhizobium sp. Root482 TaxID=1736543 RepID=UPI0009E98E6D|nr:hypothetical protein [Rhizobium sp. Root482]